VGAGPAGLFAANVLVRAGIDCVVFERLAEDAVRARARAGLIEHRTTRLPAIWQAVEFSHGMLQLLLASQPGTAEATFHEGLRQARLTRLMNDETFARAFALAYVGIDP
jgi:2-polyprenyl-6-methoxyphenol hydroxylase-like FAD-dependent oxidoreductase